MKKIPRLLIIALIAIAIFGSVTYLLLIINHNYYLNSLSCGSMSYREAKKIGENGCGYKITGPKLCIEGYQNWQMETKATKKGCFPYCVINLVTKTAQMQWQCAGNEKP
jgi:hypothetical protein